MKLLRYTCIIIFLFQLKLGYIYSWENLSKNWITVDSTIRADMIFLGVSCLDSLNCMTLAHQETIPGNLIRKTTDGGNSWKTVLYDTLLITKDSSGKLKFLGPSQAWDIAYITKQRALIVCDTGRIYKTEDGGITWQLFQLPVSGALGGLTKIKMANPKYGAIISYKEVLITEDSCLTWTKLNFNLLDYSPKLGFLKGISMPDSNNIFLSCWYDTTLQNESPVVTKYFSSSDRGKTWKYLPSSNNDGVAIWFINSEIGYAGGGNKLDGMWAYNPMIYKTTDGGINWEIIFQDSVIDYPMSDISFYDSDNGLAVSNDYIYKTTDAGKTWVSTPNNPNLHYAWHFGISWLTAQHPITASYNFMLKYFENSDLSVFGQNNFAGFNIYPVPANDYIEINLFNRGVNPSVEDIRIYDIFGTKVNCGIATPPAPSQEGVRIRMDVSHLSPGVYFVRVGSEIRKFIKI